MLPRLIALNEKAVDLLFPRFCVGCGREGQFICDACTKTLSRLTPPVCPRCGRPQPSGIVCPACAARTGSIDGIRSPFRFDGVIRRAIHEFKYRNLKALAKTLGGFMYDYLSQNPLPADLVVPVPLHPRRLRERGYNQSALLAIEVSRHSSLPISENGLIRLKHTPPQARTTSAEERLKNTSSAFACGNGIIKGKRVLLIDDVSTSGATLEACAAAAKAGGAVSVWGLVVAREI